MIPLADTDGVECPVARSVGEFLDELRSSADCSMKLLADPVGYISRNLAETTGMHRGAASELIKSAFMTSQGTNGTLEEMFRKPPAVTSTVIEQVKALPEKDITLLIRPDADLVIPPHGGGASKNIYRAFTVDLENFCSKRKKVFTQLQALPCDPLQSRQKNIVSTFVLSCLEPYVLLPNSPQTYPAARPRQVLLESTVASEDPQVHMFLSMMGCTVVEAASPALLALLDETKEDVKSKSTRHAFAFAPHLRDSSRGLKCGNCEMDQSLRNAPVARPTTVALNVKRFSGECIRVNTSRRLGVIRMQRRTIRRGIWS
jgi:hypothetical protein